MMPQSQIIFDKSNSVRSKTKECNNLFRMLNWKVQKCYPSKVLNFNLYMFLNSSQKLTLMDLPLWVELTHLEKQTQNLY
jgi:hypothetical protein